MDDKASSKSCSPETDPKFWEWLRNRDKPAQQEQRVQLELPKPPVYRPETNNQDSNRGVTVIELC